MDRTIEIGSRWQHYKGRIAKVVAIAKHTETGEVLVVYLESRGTHWARPMDNFLEILEGGSPRFIKLGSGETPF